VEWVILLADLGEQLEARSAVLVAVFHAELRKTPGIVSVPIRPSIGATAP
jgi:hypothetical protein